MSFVFLDPPVNLIGPDGRPRFGVYGGPIAQLNCQDFAYKQLRRTPWTLSRKAAGWLLKKWQFVGVLDEGFVFGSAVIDLQYIGATFSYLYDRRTGEMTGVNAQAPLARGVQFSPSAVAGVSRYQSGAQLVEFDNHLDHAVVGELGRQHG